MNLAETEAVLTAGLEPRCPAERRTRALRLMREDGRIAPELVLQIYANNTSGARLKSLAAAYPACLRILGEACFNGIARRFIERTPSEQPDLNLYGASFGDFLDEWTATQEQLADFRYLGDLARLEWLCHKAYYAGDDPPFDFAAFSEFSYDAQERLRFRLGDSVGLLRSGYPVMAIREANLSDGDATEVWADETPEFLVVSRPDLQPRVERVDEMSFRVLSACRDGNTLGEIIDASGRRADKAAEILPMLVRRAWIAGFVADRAGTPRGS